ncbi:NUDIX hydrolase [Roseovarius aestuariivivens]|uniref:NUDIX hydrolase n=1 Tax=Roseovarius aestuariivivens TaxID=1888910 RepID=UPI0010800F46|nr:NUDIX hydrolase [Roseovarius aestuariivivens]
MMRRFGETPDPNRHYVPRPGAYAILVRDGQVLLTHQAEPKPEYQLPGGGIDTGESPVRALHREVFEETGWRITAPRRLGAFKRFAYMPEYDLWAEKTCLIYTALPVRPHGPPVETGHSAVWAAPEVAARVVGNPGDRHFVRTLLARVL